MGERRSPADHTSVMGVIGPKLEGTCPLCHQGDLITISMTVSGSDLAFTTCHLCEAKWWFRDGKSIPLQSVIGLVESPRA